jgi:hypothetical protein
MERNINIQQELNEISHTIANISIVPTYTIPVNYFENLTIEVLFKINNDNPFIVPNNYFESLSTNILQKIKTTETELSTIAPTLASLPKINVFTTPVNYFEKIEIPSIYEAKVIDLIPKKKKNFTWVKYAATACIISIISITTLTYLNTSTKENEIIAGTTVTYNEIKNIDVETEINKISNAEVDTYLCDNGLIACAEKADDNITKELENLNISDEELEKILGEKTN